MPKCNFTYCSQISLKCYELLLKTTLQKKFQTDVNFYPSRCPIYSVRVLPPCQSNLKGASLLCKCKHHQHRCWRTVQRRCRNPLGLMVSALFTRRRGNEPRRAGHQGQGPVVCKKQPPWLKGLLFKEHDVFFYWFLQSCLFFFSFFIFFRLSCNVRQKSL